MGENFLGGSFPVGGGGGRGFLIPGEGMPSK